MTFRSLSDQDYERMPWTRRMLWHSSQVSPRIGWSSGQISDPFDWIDETNQRVARRLMWCYSSRR
jgi:hypothetical protein